jgi:hypothetical protein
LNDQAKEDEMGRACGIHGEKKNAYRILVGTSEGKRLLGRLDNGWRIILKWMLQKSDGVVWTVLIWLRIGRTSGGLL